MSATPDEIRRLLETPEYAIVPEATRLTVLNYLRYRHRPGSATRALLERDMDAIVLADEKLLLGLPALLRLFHNEFPPRCWGSKEKVAAWVEGRTEDPDHWPADDAVSRLGATR